MNFLKFFIIIVFITTPLFGGAQIISNPSHDDFIVDIVWRANTFIPGDFKGKALPIKGSELTLTAIVLGENQSNLEYSWIIKDSSSGARGADSKKRGDNTFSFTAEEIMSDFTHEIEVIVRNVFTGRSGKSRVEI